MSGIFKLYPPGCIGFLVLLKGVANEGQSANLRHMGILRSLIVSQGYVECAAPHSERSSPWERITLIYASREDCYNNAVALKEYLEQMMTPDAYPTGKESL